MALGNCVVVNGTPENRETLGDTGHWYDGKRGQAGLQELLGRLIENPAEVAAARPRARARAQTVFSWEAVTDSYERLFYDLTGQERSDRIRS
jgi:glycosyltransferase involved in cell wall biosynthesis